MSIAVEHKKELTNKISDLRLQVVTISKNRELVQAKLEHLSSSKEQSCVQIEKLNGEISEFNSKIQEIRIEIENQVESEKQAREEIELIKSEISQFVVKRQELEKSANDSRNAEKDILLQREGVSKELARLEERKISMQTEYDKIISGLWEEYQLTRTQAEESAKPLDDERKATTELNSIKNKIKALGNINYNAIDEYKEVSQRYEFLKVQVADVEDSKAQLNKIISELTVKMRTQFLENFEKINRNFTEIFTELFEGGKGELKLSDMEDVLECGIEINVQPPGKVIKNLALLSGGEQALVSIAIYFAIMRVNPPPFCILDEIEAALDDVNVARYAAYLRKISKNTQFIVITHRRGTMEEADVLYGVTMQDEGISKVLELDVSEVESKIGKLNK
jgi:chromosome segregation protein